MPPGAHASRSSCRFRTPAGGSARSLDSLYAQTFTDFEILAVDDGSTDGTADLLRDERDPRLQVLTTDGQGIVAALNHGLAAARGDLIARQDADDSSRADRLARQVAWLDRWVSVDVLATCAEYIGLDGRPVETDWTRTVRAEHDTATTPEAIRALLPRANCLTHGSVVMRASAVRAAGGYREAFATAEDHDLWLRLLPGHRFAKLPVRLYRSRLDPAQPGPLRRGDQAEQVGAREALVRAANVLRGCPPRRVSLVAGRDANLSPSARHQ